MANDNLKRMLEMTKRLEQTSASGSPMTSGVRKTDAVALDKQVAMLDEQVFGKYQKPEDTYDPEEEMNRWKERYKGNNIPNIVNSKLPKNIIESIISNPCNIDPVVEDPRMRALQERIDGKMPGIKSVAEIQRKLDEHDREQIELQEQLKPKQPKVETNVQSTIDYGLIKMIVESVINEKLNNLNESRNNVSSASDMRAMMMIGDKFRFLDGNDNIYECQLKYIGKKKKK